MSSNIETLDDMLGEGAFESFCSILDLETDKVEVTESLYEVDGEHITWPPEVGPSICIVVSYEHGEQIIHFQNNKFYMGEGLCNATSDPNQIIQLLIQMRRLMAPEGDTPMISWSRDWNITHYVIPSPKTLMDNWKSMGFEPTTIFFHSDNWVVMEASTEAGGKLDTFASWVSSGAPEETRPSWFNPNLQTM